MRFIEMNIDELAHASCELCEKIDPVYHPDLVVYLARGGYLIGCDVARYFGCGLAELDKHRDSLAKKDSKLLCKLPGCLKHFLREAELKFRSFRSESKDLSYVPPAIFTGRYPWPDEALRILIVDDSIDSGESIISARKAVENRYPAADVRVAVLNTFIEPSEKIDFDWVLLTNSLLSTPASADSPCYAEFCRLYETDGYR